MPDASRITRAPQQAAASAPSNEIVVNRKGKMQTAEDIKVTLPSEAELARGFKEKYYRDGEPGWSPQLRERFGHYTPDDYYETLVGQLILPGSTWADIGCGRDIFPQNPVLAGQLASRCSYVFGIDPDDNVRENKMIQGYFQGLVEDCDTTREFDLVTLRMVAEHIVNPEAAMARIKKLLRPGGHVVIYTPYKWAPMSVIASAVPFGLHNPLKRLIWDSDARDTFPTAYKLNTHKDQLRHTGAVGLSESLYVELDDCRTLAAFRWLNTLELGLQRMLRRASMRYPERCILGVYRRARE